MANTRTYNSVLSSEYQRTFQAENLALEIADLSGKAQLAKGNQFKKSYTSVPESGVYSRNADMELTDVTDTDETLTVNREFYVSEYFDEHDNLQDPKNAAAKHAEIVAKALSNDIDRDVLGEVLNASNVVDASDFGGTSGDGVALTAANVVAVASIANEKLNNQNVPRRERVAVFSPRFERILSDYISGKDTAMGDAAFEKGYLGMFQGFRAYSSTQLPSSYRLLLATNPSNGNTVTIGTGATAVTFTFVSSIGSTPGNVLIGGSVDTTRANLAALINAPTTTTANGVALTGNNAKRVQKFWAATNDDTNNWMDLKIKGGNATTVTSSGLNAADGWDADMSVTSVLFGSDKAISCIVQEMPKIKMVETEARNGMRLNGTSLYGTKLFSDGALSLVNAKIKIA